MAQVYGRIGDEAPDCDDAGQLRAFVGAVIELRRKGLILAYHDRSDGGLFATLAEMAFAGHCGLDITLAAGDHAGAVAELFAEELGAVLQVETMRLAEVRPCSPRRAWARWCATWAQPKRSIASSSATVTANSVLDATRTDLRSAWSETSYRMQRLRDNPVCAHEEREQVTDPRNPGLFATLSYEPAEDIAAPYILRGARPEIAILREQGVNSQLEMAAAFDRAGFRPADVHMTDLIAGRTRLERFKGVVACGGFSYGDVLGAGEGWAKSILFNAALREQFAALLRALRQLRARRLQRLPDDVDAEGADPGGRPLAAVRAQSLGAVRGPRGPGRNPADALDLLPRHGRFGAADRRRARRGSRGVRATRRRSATARRAGW